MHFNLATLAVAATTFFASANALSPQDVPADLPVSKLLTTAQTHLSRGETNEALVYYDAAIARDPTNYLSVFKRATAYLSLGRTSQATDDFNKVLSLKPGFEGAHLQLARLRAKAGDWDAAKVQFGLAGKDPKSAEFVELEEAKLAAHMAEMAGKGGKWEECVSHAGTAIVVAVRSPQLRELRAHCRFELGEPELALSDLQHVLHMKPGDTSPHIVISATAFYALGDMDNGIGQVKKCLQSDPDSKICKKLHKQEKKVEKTYKKIQAQLSRGQPTTAGRSLVGTGDDSGLVSDVRQQVEELKKNKSIPKNARIQLLENLIELTCQAYTESSHKEAAKYCDESLQLNPDSFWGLLHKGKTQFKSEMFEAAIATFEKAAEVRPDQKEKVNPILNKAHIALKRSKTKDYYKVLGVEHDADERQIKSAYRKQSKIFHPDKAAKQGFSKEEAEKKMASINEAYEVLSDPELRARFDRGDDPNSQERPGNPFQQGNPFGGGGHPFMFQQGGGGPNIKFQFGGQPFGF
ncbi:DnaJ like subfamily C member 3 [Fusarium austroafricanum]|uniref:Tetratricopeptide repeat and J domain-containing co-chaperone DNJ1 n=1 Tax=Fusarium austroafricanum TaxID=2364996 RepID=A0A8H4KPW0_9HYPO|nr:DnaJ like subfamily C member 3 [Fusarium austroafricanum]